MNRILFAQMGPKEISKFTKCPVTLDNLHVATTAPKFGLGHEHHVIVMNSAPNDTLSLCNVAVHAAR